MFIIFYLTNIYNETIDINTSKYGRRTHHPKNSARQASAACACRPNISFHTGSRRPTFNNKLIKKKEFQSVNTVDAKGPDMNKPTVMVPLKEHVKASYSNGDLKKMSFVGKHDIVNTYI